MRPKVSVVMPAYNVPLPWLTASIESIINQTLNDFELIIVDDGSTNGLYDTCRLIAGRDDRIRLFRTEENRGAFAASNFGIMQAKSDLIARHDADDISLPDRLQKQYQYMLEHPNVVLCGLQMDMIFEEDVPETMRKHSLQYLSWYNARAGDQIDRFFVQNICLASGTFMFYKDKFLEAGMYREESRLMEEEVVLRLKHFGRIAKYAEPLYIYRIHNRSTYSLHTAMVDKRMSEIRNRVLKEMLEPGTQAAVWGVGKGGREFLTAYRQDPEPTFHVTTVIDGSGRMVGQHLLDYEVKPKEELDRHKFDKILIAVSSKKALLEIRQDLKMLGYSEEDSLELYPEMD